MNLAKFEFDLEFQNSFQLPEFKGSTFRGKFGHVLKRTICLQTHQDCEQCALRKNCPYIYLFETTSAHHQNVVRPFIIEPPLTNARFVRRQEHLFLNLILIGKALEYLPYFVYTFRRMGEEGIGEDRGYFTISSLRAVDVKGKRYPIYHPDTQLLHQDYPRIELDDFYVQMVPQVTIEFLTPTRIFVRKRLVQDLPFPILLRAILRRYRSLRYFHDDGATERFAIDWEEAEKIEIVHNALKFKQLQRYSNRQKSALSISGFVGRITYRGNLGQFWPWLKIGEYLHVGKGTVFGLGWYKIVA